MSAREILHASESNEWYTPSPIIESARTVMGSIDLDPASSAAANKIVQATRYFTIDDDGLSRPWLGNVFLNPPYGRGKGHRSNQALWSEYLIREYDAGRVEQAVLLVNAMPSNRWWQQLWRFPICFHCPRIKFIPATPEPKHSPTHSNALIYLGTRTTEFAREFQRYGAIVGLDNRSWTQLSGERED